MDKIKKLVLNLSEGHPLEEHLLCGKEGVVFREDSDGAYDFFKDEIILGTFPKGRFVFLRITENTFKTKISCFDDKRRDIIRRAINQQDYSGTIAIIKFRAMAIVDKLIAEDVVSKDTRMESRSPIESAAEC